MLIGEYRDPSPFRHDNKWWLFTTEGIDDRHDTLQLFYADDLLGPWQAHPLSPVIVEDPNIARPGGRVTVFDGRLIRYTQDTFPIYGNKVRAFEITELTTTTYTEPPVVENPILDADGLGWNAVGMHHIDPHQLPDTTWLAVVDGNGDPDQVDVTNPLILDNAGSGTSSIGTWYVSGGADPYGTDSLYANEAGASYTFSIDLTAPGEYQVFAWWTEWRNRRTSVPYDISDLGGTGTVTVNQQLNGGQWNRLGSTWNFGANATITLRSLGDGTTSADAIMLVPVSN